MAAAARRVVIVDGVRIPFQMSHTVYKKNLAVELGQMAMKGKAKSKIAWDDN